MCFSESSVESLNKWNWDGDVIIHDPVVPSSRPVVGFTRGHQYEIDVREFLVTERNALIQRVLKHDLDKFIREELKGSPDLFYARKENAFDYRAHVIHAFVSEKIAYADKEKNDPWQFPDETIELKTGDCDDRALLLASLLISSGISSFNVRVALGKVRISGEGQKHDFGHMWVMYKTERGRWILLEPLVSFGPKTNKTLVSDLPGTKDYFGRQNVPVKAEYIPYYIFNDFHLWGMLVKGRTINFQDDLVRRKKWTKFNPKFAGEVHKNILQLALKDAPADVKKEINRYFSRAILGFIGPYVDDFDRGTYNPFIHFDNCYIKEGWDLVNQNLAKFRSSGDLHSFFCAAHSIADFYAHTSYVHFAKILPQADPANDYPQLFDPANPSFESVPSYSPLQTPAVGFDLTGSKFSTSKKYWKGGDKKTIAASWAGKVISGRYAQPNDTWPGAEAFITEGILSVIPDNLLKAPDFPQRGWVPHHNEIAVDNSPRASSHILYQDGNQDRTNKANFDNQFKWRKNAAIQHIRKTFEENRGK